MKSALNALSVAVASLAMVSGAAIDKRDEYANFFDGERDLQFLTETASALHTTLTTLGMTQSRGPP
jgi:hypothetical protein